jgi:hypothetical protein
LFFFAYDIGDEVFFFDKFRKNFAHLLTQSIDQLVDKSIFLVEKGEAIPDGSAQNAANHIAGTGIGG